MARLVMTYSTPGCNVCTSVVNLWYTDVYVLYNCFKVPYHRKVSVHLLEDMLIKYGTLTAIYCSSSYNAQVSIQDNIDNIGLLTTFKLHIIYINVSSYNRHLNWNTFELHMKYINNISTINPSWTNELPRCSEKQIKVYITHK